MMAEMAEGRKMVCFAVLKSFVNLFRLFIKPGTFTPPSWEPKKAVTAACELIKDAYEKCAATIKGRQP